MLHIQPKDIPVGELHQYLLGAVGPRPIALASTLDQYGNPNLSPFSFSMYLVLTLLLLSFLQQDEYVTTRQSIP